MIFVFAKRKFRLQFSLATLLAIVAISAVAAHWYATKSREAKAREAWMWARGDYVMGGVTVDALYQPSVDLLHAELAVPFCDRQVAYAGHLE